jgi:hypothetical protein
MNIGGAVLGTQDGHRVCRMSWTDGRFIYYVPANEYPAQTDVAKAEFGEMVQYNPYFAMKNADGTVSMYTPTVDDLIAQDWTVM